MNERLITLLCAAGAFALFYAIFLPAPESMEEKVSQPTTEEHGANGYLGAVRWLESTGVRAVSLRERFDWLERHDTRLARTGNLLITTLPHRYGVRERELEALRDWVTAGNTMLVLAALADTPDWTMPHVSRDLAGDVARLTGVGFEVPPPDPLPARMKGSADADFADGAEALAAAFKRLTEPKEHRIVPNRPHPLFDGVRLVRAESEFPASEWRAMQPNNGFALSLAHDADNGRDALWVRRYGGGRFLISGYGSLFSNEQLGRADNARLLANITAQTLGVGGAVLFDDQHQGLSALYDAEAFFADQRLRATLWLLLALWLIWVLGATRLRGAPPEPPAPRETAFVEATGGLLARVVHPVQAGERLIELFFNDLRRRLSLPEDGTPLWEWLERQPRVIRSDLATLRGLDARLRGGKRIDLTRLQNLLVKLQGQV